MHISPAGVTVPDLGLRFAVWSSGRRGVVLFDPQIAQVEPRGPHGGQQLVAVVLQGLQPGARRCANSEHASLQP
jgi:hypothetical protein